MFEWWELACQRCRRRCFPAQAQCSHRRQAGSHRRLGTKWHGSFSLSVRFSLSRQRLFASCLNGGSWLGSDAGDAVFLRKRCRAIAGKPAPTGDWALSGMDIFAISAQRPLGPGAFCRMFEWWELACQRCRRRCFPAQAQCSHRRQAGSYR